MQTITLKFVTPDNDADELEADIIKALEHSTLQNYQLTLFRITKSTKEEERVMAEKMFCTT